jgi:hypothetical protein
VCSPGQIFAAKPRVSPCFRGIDEYKIRPRSGANRAVIRFAAIQSRSRIEIRGNGADRSAPVPIRSTLGEMGEAV